MTGASKRHLKSAVNQSVSPQQFPPTQPARIERKEALLYQRHEGGAVTCLSCQRRCVILEGKTGWCRTRINEGGRLFSLIYGEVSAVSIIPIEKKPVFHFLPGSRWLSLGSVGCNFRYPGCQNWEIAHWQGGPMFTEYIAPQKSAATAEAKGCTGISWTFNEPSLWLEYTHDAAKIAKQKGLLTNYVTNGTLTEEALASLAPHLDVYRVDIIENRIENGKCPQCGTAIPGRF